MSKSKNKNNTRSKTRATPSGARTARKKSGGSAVHKTRTPSGVIGTAAAVLVLALFVIGVALLRAHVTTNSASGQIIPSTPAGASAAQELPKRVAAPTTVPGVLAWDTQGWPGNGKVHPGALEHRHVSGPVSYAVLPPVGGPHNATWMNAGVYTKPIPSELAVHNLEHGAVWITYDPNLPTAQIGVLTTFIGQQSLIPEARAKTGVASLANRYLVLSPWATNSLPSPIVLSSWGYQLRVSSATDPRMQQFVNTFRNSAKYTPEYRSPEDGVPVQTGGSPQLDGSQ